MGITRLVQSSICRRERRINVIRLNLLTHDSRLLRSHDDMHHIDVVNTVKSVRFKASSDVSSQTRPVAMLTIVLQTQSCLETQTAAVELHVSKRYARKFPDAA